jgi:hypothetical protein
MKVNEHNLLQAIKKMNLDGKIQKETNQIYIVIKHEEKEFPLFIRELHDGELLQFLTFIPCYVEQSKLNDVSRFLHMLNKELDMPGFCLDETSMTVFYRLVLPTLNKELQEGSFEAFINTTTMVCKTFGTIIEALAIGAMSIDEILRKASELKTSKV